MPVRRIRKCSRTRIRILAEPANNAVFHCATSQILLIRFTLRLYVVPVLRTSRCRRGGGSPGARLTSSIGVCQWKKKKEKKSIPRACIVIAHCSWIRRRRSGIYDPFPLPKFARWSFFFAIVPIMLPLLSRHGSRSCSADKEGNLSRVKPRARETLTRQNIR